MEVGITSARGVETPRDDGPPQRLFGILLLTLAVALVLNTALGPLVTGVVDYPIAETLKNQLIGLEVVSVILVAPLCVTAGILALRGHRAAAVLAFGPAAYTAYMFVQYVLGPEYGTYARVVPFQLAIFTLAGALAARAWTLADLGRLPTSPRRTERVYGAVLVALAAFVVSRYLDAITGTISGEPIAAEFAGGRTFYWSIVLLDLGVVVPATAAAGVALIRGVRPARKALYAVLGWFALVPPSVAAMGATMAVNDDPHSSIGQVLVLGLVAVLFAAFAVRVYWPLFGRPREASPRRATTASTAALRSRVPALAACGISTLMGGSAGYGALALLGDWWSLDLHLLSPLPFDSWTLPGVALAAFVAAPMLTAAWAEWRGRRLAAVCSAGAGLVLVGWIALQLLLMGLALPGIQLFCIAAGVLLVLLRGRTALHLLLAARPGSTVCLDPSQRRFGRESAASAAQISTWEVRR